MPHAPPAFAAPDTTPSHHRIVIVGGGAGGLELAARLGDLARARSTPGGLEVVLIDRVLTHVWKPLLHELAAGTLRTSQGEVDFLQQARRHGFRFHPGAAASMDRTRREIHLAPLVDEFGTKVAPRRTMPYDTAVIAVGSVVNDFGTPGVREHALRLDDAEQARQFHRRLLSACARAELSGGGPVDVVVVGGGATGVELVAELQEATQVLAGYGDRLARQPQAVRLRLVEAGPRLLAAQPEAVARHALEDLAGRGIDVRLGWSVVAVHADRVTLAQGTPAPPGQTQTTETLPADLVVWAAGIRGPAVLGQLDGLELNRQGQLVVRPTLQTTRDNRVFAIGDCAALPGADGRPLVPAAAQAAHQQAHALADALLRWRPGDTLPAFTFQDHGTLVSLGRRNATGRLQGTASDTGVTLAGWWARLAYWLLQRGHLVTLHGWVRTVLGTVGGWLLGQSQPRVKLH